MSYEKQNFTNNQVLTHNHLNHIEDGIKTVENTVSNIWQTIYPVGAIYISMNETSPASLFGGTWERIVDRFLLAGSSTSYPIGSMGGNSSNTHSHQQTFGYDGNGIYFLLGYNETNSTVIQDVTRGNLSVASAVSAARYDNTFNETINTMPPYLSVYMWKRTA